MTWKTFYGQPTDVTKTQVPLPKDPVSLEGAPILGAGTALVAIVEFSDFECPYCGQFARQTFPILREKYIDPGLIQIAFRHNALPRHPRAMPAALASGCAARQGKFWNFHDQLFQDPSRLEDADFATYASTSGMDITAFNRCRAESAETDIEHDADAAKALGLTGTPAFLIGIKESPERVRVSDIIAGAAPVAQFSSVLDRLIKSSRNSH